MEKEELSRVLQKHALWVIGDPEGTRADLSYANLSCADLSGVDLRGANLSCAIGVMSASDYLAEHFELTAANPGSNPGGITSGAPMPQKMLGRQPVCRKPGSGCNRSAQKTVGLDGVKNKEGQTCQDYRKRRRSTLPKP